MATEEASPALHEIADRRVAALQEKVNRLRAMLEEVQYPGVGWHCLVGSHADAPEAFEKAMRLGRQWRESFRPEAHSRECRTEDDRS